MQEIPDHDLILAVQRGERDAFAALLERHYTLIFKTAWKWCGNRENAEDIAQEVSIKLAHAVDQFRFESAFTTWLYRLTLNVAKDYYRARNRRQAREEPMYEDMVYASQEATPEEKAQYKDLLRAIAVLPDALRETVLLVCWQGMSHHEASLVLRCSEGTVSWRVHEARKKIVAYLGEGSVSAQKIRTVFFLLFLMFFMGGYHG